ncbi:MAG TPA: histidine kinase dimerization/phospho-acceptor domain-containing protein, partial [Acidimicrobiales bacterium]|nr:histidine kinase dimerization/phospho-acceptor domain-containing protein [Acidimicrobiales bacterium]
MALSAVLAVALAVAVVAALVAVWAAVAARRRTRAALVPLVGGSGSLDEALSRVGTAFAALSERATTADGLVDRLTDALSAIPEGVVLADEHGQVWFRNEVAQLFAGARHGEALADLAVTELLDAALRAGQDAQYPSQYLELYGPPRRTLLIRALPLREQGTLLGAVAVIEDVSERRRLEAVRRDFVANVSHELKSPVGALGILAEAMQLEDEPAVSRRLAERMQTEAFRVARIIDDLLDLSRIESEEAPQREPIAVHTFVAQAVERMRPVAEHRGITLALSEGPRRLTVVGDRRQLVSAVHNLLDNAVKYSEDDSVVEVRIRSVADA